MANSVEFPCVRPHRAHEVRLPGKACQPEPSSPARTAYSVDPVMWSVACYYVVKIGNNSDTKKTAISAVFCV